MTDAQRAGKGMDMVFDAVVEQYEFMVKEAKDAGRFSEARAFDDELIRFRAALDDLAAKLRAADRFVEAAEAYNEADGRLDMESRAYGEESNEPPMIEARRNARAAVAEYRAALAAYKQAGMGGEEV